MARPFTASDDDILQAATSILSKRGPERFSIAEVASEVGVSRAAIIQRFKSTRALRTTSLTHLVDRFVSAIDEQLATLPAQPGGDNLLHLSAFMGSYVHTRESSARFFANYTAHIQDHEVAELQARRGAALRSAISQVMPKTSVDHEVAVNAFGAHLTGNILAWLSMNDSDPRRHLVLRTAEWLRLVRIPFSEQLPTKLSRSSSARTYASKTRVAGKHARARTKPDNADR